MNVKKTKISKKIVLKITMSMTRTVYLKIIKPTGTCVSRRRNCSTRRVRVIEGERDIEEEV